METNAINCASWEHFVNTYRHFFGTNNGLDSSGVRAMSERELQSEIKRMSAILKNEGLLK